MLPHLWTFFLLILLNHAEAESYQNISQDLSSQIQRTVEEVIAGNYLSALLDILHYQSTNMWTADLLNKIRAYVHAQNIVITSANLQVSVKNYLENLLSHPKVLLSEFQQMNHRRFHTALKYLFGKEQGYLELGNVVIDLAGIRERIFQSPGGNRTLFHIILEKCFPTLDSAECVGALSQILRESSVTYLQAYTISSLPKHLPEDAFRNLSMVFKDLYDRIPANAQRALYGWMTQILQRNYSVDDNSSSWVSAESLWILGRYMIHLPVETIRKINPYEMRLYISYDNATKQLDTVFDITPDHAHAFLERINASGFDMKNTSTLYRLGLLVCFYKDLEEVDANVARVLLHQMIKCNQLRGFQADVQKLKSQLLDIAIQNQTLNDTLGSLSDAVVGLTTNQLESLSPEAVHSTISTLNQVSGWSKSQIMILSSKYLMYEKALSFHNVSQMGPLMIGISTQLFHSMNPSELAQVIRGALVQRAADLSPAQRQGILRKMISSTDLLSVIADLQGPFLKEVSLFDLWKGESFYSSLVKEKELRPSQALYLYELLSKKTPVAELLSTGQLVKGIRCWQIEKLSPISFLNTFSVFENNLDLLSPYQINCLAWKFWTVSNTSMPPYLFAVLPAEYLEYITGSLCVPFVASLGKAELDHLIFSVQKKQAIMQKVQECLNGSVADEYDIDLLGKLICHLSPAFFCEGISPETMVTALHEFKRCPHLSYEQKMDVTHMLHELYGSPRNWSAETTRDNGLFVALLPKEELNILVEKFPDIISEIALKTSGPVPLSEELLLAHFESVRNASFPIRAPSLTHDCAEVTAPSSDEILKLSEANMFWSVRELTCMDSETFSKTVERLGSVARFNASQLTALKEKAKQVWGSLTNWKSYHIVSLGRIATALNETEIGALDLSSIDTVAALSQQTEWNQGQAKSILHGYLEDSEQTMDTLKSFDLAGLGASLCALEATEIASINSLEFSAVIARIGSLLCSRSVLEGFKKKAESVFGMAVGWNRSILQEVGTIAAGLNDKELKAVNKELMPYFHPTAIKCIPDEIFKELSPEQIANLGPENAAVVTESQRQHLNELQLRSLQLALDGARTNFEESPLDQSTVRPMYTSALNSAPSRFSLCLLAAFILHLVSRINDSC
ncbi:otoancorin [Pogona vitticeps]